MLPLSLADVHPRPPFHLNEFFQLPDWQWIDCAHVLPQNMKNPVKSHPYSHCIAHGALYLKVKDHAFQFERMTCWICSDCVLLFIKTLPSHSSSPCLHFNLLCFCSNCALALRYIVARTGFLCSSPSPHSSCFLCTRESSALGFLLCSWISTLLKFPNQ